MLRVENCKTCRFFSPQSIVRLRATAELAAFGSGAFGMDREEVVDACAARPIHVPAPGWCGEWKPMPGTICLARPPETSWTLCRLAKGHTGVEHTDGYITWKEKPNAEVTD